MKNRKFKQSRFCHIYKKNDIHAYYHSLAIETLYLDEVLASHFNLFKKPYSLEDVLACVPPGHKQDMANLVNRAIDVGILISDEKEDDDLLRRHKERFLGKPSIGILYLILTTRCNLNCRYCFVKSIITNSETASCDMQNNVVNDALETYAKNLSSRATRKTIIFYGGEPLLNYRAIEFALAKIEEMKNYNKLPFDLAVTINTNATRVTHEIIQLFKKHNIAVSVSLDGPAEFHDQNRIKWNGIGSFKDTLDGFNRLKDAGIQTGISCTATSQILDNLPEITEWFITFLGADFLGFNPLTAVNQEFPNDEDYAKKYALALIESFKVARKLGCYEDRMMRKVEAFVKKTIYPFDCAGCGRQLVIAPDGGIGVCHAYIDSRRYFSASNFANFDAYVEPHWLEWSARSPLSLKKCSSCEALGICGGGCPFNAASASGSIWTLDESFCIFSKIVLDWLIWDAWECQEESSLKN